MAKKYPELIVKISGDTKAFDKAINGLPDTAEKGVSKLAIAAAAAGVAFIALAAGAASAVDEFRRFEKEFSNVVTLLDKSSFSAQTLEDGIFDLKKGIIDLRATSGESFDNLNKGLFDIVSAGIKAGDAISVLRDATDLALAGGTDVSIAVGGLTSAIKAFGDEAGTAREVSEKFFTAQKLGKTTIAELSTDIGQVAATASSMGVSFDEVLASVSAATLASIKTNQAFTGLKAVFSNIIKPSKDAADEAERLGISFNSTALKSKGLKGFLDSVTESAKFNSTSLEKLFGSSEALNIIFALTGSQAGSFADAIDNIGDAQARNDTFTDAIITKNETLDQKYKKLQGSTDALKTAIGDRLAPAMANFVDNAIFGMETLRISMDDTEEAGKRVAGVLERLALSQAGLIAGLVGADIGGLEDTFNGLEFDPTDSQAAIDFLKTAKERSIEAQSEFEANARTEKLAAEQEAADESIRIQEDKDERQREIDERKAERDAEKAERDLELEAERFELEIERLDEHLSNKDEVEAQFDGLKDLRAAKELQKRATTDKQREKAAKTTKKAEDELERKSLEGTLDNLAFLVGEETAAGKAIFLIKKAQQFSASIVNTAEAVTEALPNIPLAAAVGIAGAAQTAVIASTAFQGAADGGIVQGGSFGRDSQPFLLARDEIVAPSSLNRLSPSFDETAAEALGIGGGSVNVEIGFTDDASRFLTAGQREDSALGV